MERIMDDAGSCGRFQTVQVFCIGLCRFMFMWGAFLMMYGNYNPGWRCRHNTPPLSNRSTPINSANRLSLSHRPSGIRDSFDDKSLLLLSPSKGSTQRSSSDFFKGFSHTRNNINNNDNEIMTSNANIRNDNVSVITTTSQLLYCNNCDVIESCEEGIEFNPESSTIVTEFGLVCDRQWITTVILVVTNAGFAFGSGIVGQICEKYGRKIGLYGSTAVVMISSGAAIFSPNWQTYAFCNFFMGAGAFGITLSSYIFAIEFLNSKWRGYTASRPVMSLSLCALSILMKLLKNWRHLHMATFLLSFLACCGYFIVDESPRWLFVHSQREKGEKVIQKIAKRNGRQPIKGEDIEIFVQSLELEKQCISFSFLDLFTLDGFGVMTLKFTIALFLNVIVYRAISFGLKSLPGNFYINAIVSSFVQFAILLSAGPITNCTGRRWAGVLYSLLGSASCFAIVVSCVFLAEGHTRETVIKISAYIAKAVTQNAMAASVLLAAESFPTAIRSLAMSFNETASSLGSFIFTFVIPSDNDDISFAICYAVMALCFFVNIFIFSSFVETNRLCLKDSVNSQTAGLGKKASPTTTTTTATNSTPV